MIDFHTHTLFSDGVLVPSELIRRADVIGYQAIAFTDHGDSSNLDIIIPHLVKVCKEIAGQWKIKAIPGIELTHVPPKLIPALERDARKLGAKLVVVHGETITEPVSKGTNRAALESNVDILAHPGLITEDEVRLAKANNVYLEITGRKGHCLTNGHVSRLAMKVGAKLVINSDAHAPGDLMTLDFARSVAIGAGMSDGDFKAVRLNAKELLEQVE
ncbi:MAG: histidinol phosphate phosphatase domain-containing protein [Proteobacteria bacterium]|nr:histidinol phosphate phosphatase domain-containing protein [Pseudomonadota bacterium]